MIEFYSHSVSLVLIVFVLGFPTCLQIVSLRLFVTFSSLPAPRCNRAAHLSSTNPARFASSSFGQISQSQRAAAPPSGRAVWPLSALFWPLGECLCCEIYLWFDQLMLVFSTLPVSKEHFMQLFTTTKYFFTALK